MPAHTHCRVCGTALPPPFLDLGSMPLANSFLSSRAEAASEARYPLAVTACPDCRFVQLNYVVPAEQLYRDYIYVSSTSDGVRHHADWLAGNLIQRYGWKPTDCVVEIASNDGTVLKAFQQRGVRVLGVEPALNIASIARADGVPTEAEFFTEPVGEAIARANGRAAAILGRHVFAHVDNVNDFLRGVSKLLADDGVLVIEVPYLGDFLEKLEFDTIYHEHLSYVSLEPMARLCEQNGLRLVDVEKADLHGGVVILHIAKAASGRARSDRLRTMIDAERANGYGDPSRLARFARDVEAWRARFVGLVRSLVAGGATLVGYGAAAKANTLMNYCPEAAASLRVIFDRSPHKHGKFTPGTHIKVEPVDQWRSTGATHMVILAWNFQDEIVRQMQPFADAGGRFVVPIPEPRVL